MEQEPFRRKPLLARSPPQRKMSVPDINLTGSPCSKRRRAELEDGGESTPQTVVASGRAMSRLENLTLMMLQMKDDISNDKLTKGDLMVNMDHIMDEVAALHSGGDRPLTRPLTMTAETQTCTAREIKNAMDIQAILQEVTAGMGNDQIRKVAEKWWPKGAYRCTKTTSDTKNWESTRIMIIDPTDEMSKSLLSEVTAHFPSLDRIVKRNPESGQIAVAESRDTVTLDGEDTELNEGGVRKIILGFLKKDEKVEENVLQMLRKTQEKLELNSQELIISAANLMDGNKIRKYVECLFVHCETNISVLTSRQRINRSSVAKRQRNDTILVKSQTGETFAEVASKLKDAIKPDELGVKVKSLTSTADGNVRIIVNEKKKGGRQSLLTEIMKKTNTNASIKNAEKSLLISDLDESVTPVELRNALETAAGCSSISPGEIKKGNNGLNIVYVRMPAASADKLVCQSHIKIGWTYAKIKELVVPEFCRYCQKFGHKKCQAEQQEACCRRCGEKGHIAKGCTSPLACYVCGCSGHRADSMKCPEYRAAVKAIEKSKKPPKKPGPSQKEASTTEVGARSEELPSGSRINQNAS